MWKLWHKLFGWHYVIAVYGNASYVNRVYGISTRARYIKPIYYHYVLQADFTAVCGDNYIEWIPLTFEKLEDI